MFFEKKPLYNYNNTSEKSYISKPNLNFYINRNKYAPISPKAFPNLYAWYDLTKPKDTAVIYDGSGNISQINDLSGNRRHATQGTIAKQGQYITSGINSLPSISAPDIAREYRFSGWNLAKTYTSFFVINKDDDGTNAGVLYFGSGNQIAVRSADDIFFSRINSSNASITGFTSGADVILYSRRNLTAYDMSYNTTGKSGTEANWVDDFEPNRLIKFMTGLFSEAIIYDGVLTDDQVTIVKNYLSAKYGIAV